MMDHDECTGTLGAVEISRGFANWLRDGEYMGKHARIQLVRIASNDESKRRGKIQQRKIVKNKEERR